MAAHSYNHRAQRGEAGETAQGDQLGLHCQFPDIQAYITRPCIKISKWPHNAIVVHPAGTPK